VLAARTALPESTRETLADQIVDPRAGAVYALVPGTSAAAQGPYVLERNDRSSHVIFGLGQAGVTAITPPASCWG